MQDGVHRPGSTLPEGNRRMFVARPALPLIKNGLVANTAAVMQMWELILHRCAHSPIAFRERLEPVDLPGP